MAIGYGVAVPKGTPTKTLKRRLARAEAKVAAWCRAQCVARDGRCRFHSVNHGDIHNAYALLLGFPSCEGPWAWAHMHIRRRSKTRGMDPTYRHDPRHTLMLCQRVHEAYDAKDISITPLSRKGANGPLKFRVAR